MTSNPLTVAWMAIRPKTLPAAVAPVVMATAMAFGDGIHHFPTALLALAGALTIQIGTNLANDYFDFQKGADTSERVGPTRVTQAGLVSPRAMLTAVVLTFLLAAGICALLVLRAGWPLIVIGVLSILSGILYTAGPRPLGYIGLGELFVLIFFGPVAVAGTYYAQSLEMTPAVILAGFGPGFLSAAILVVNNLRDIETDRKSGKGTLAVRLGKRFAQDEYLYAVLFATLLPIAVFALINDHLEILWSSAVCLLAVPAVAKVYTQTDGPTLNNILAYTGRLLFLYCALFGIGWAL